MSLIRRLSNLFSHAKVDREIDAELKSHIEMRIEDNLAAGMSAEQARRNALVQFGNRTATKEKVASMDAALALDSIWSDIRFAWRQLSRNPGFAATAILVLALGIGASVAIFAFVDAAMIQPLPYTDSNRLMAVDESEEMFPRDNLSYYDYLDWKRLNKTLASLDVYTSMGYLLQSSSGTEPVPAARVSDGFFSTLGVKLMLGRGFLPGEDAPGRAKIVIVSYNTWLKRFGARRDIVGQSVNLSGDTWTIVGVLPREFAFAPRGNAEFWTPLLDPSGCEQRRGCHNLDGIGRLRDGVTMEQALTDLKAIAGQLEKLYPKSNTRQGASIEPLSELIIGKIRPILLLLLSAAGLLLLIASVNVASLLLVRSESRRREIAVRGALGATAGRITRQFVTEGLLLAFVGCAAGLLVSAWLMSLLKQLIPKAAAAYVPFFTRVTISAHVGLFAATVALCAALLLAATPTMRLSFQPIRDGLAEGGRTAAGRFWRRVGANLVVVELAVAVVLLVGAGLLGQSFYRLLHVEIGFDSDHLAVLQMMAPPKIYPRDDEQAALYREAARRLSALPGVQSVGMTTTLPVNCYCNTTWIRVPGRPFHGEHNDVGLRDVTPGYLPTLRARLIRGRMFSEADDAGKPQVIVINQTLARKYFPGEDPVGKMIGNAQLDPKSMREIIGEVEDVREGALDSEPWPVQYSSIYQDSDNFVTLVVRTSKSEAAMLPTLVSAMHQIDPNLGVFGEETMNQAIDETQTAILHRSSTWLVGGFAFIALVLGVVGLYGAIAFSVSRRTREIGVRMALGAQRGTLYRMVLREAGWLTAIGLAIGLAGSVGASLLMRSLLFGVAACDAFTLTGVAALLGLAALAASYLPARRAASANPVEALRAE